MIQSTNWIRGLRVVAKRAALDFVNSIDPRQGTRTIDYLRNYTDLAAWGARAGVASPETRSRLTRLARENPAKAGQALENARQLREALYRIFSRIAVDRRPSASDLELLRMAFQEGLGRAKLEHHGRRYRWQLDHDLESIRWSVARDAVAMLEDDDLRRLKLCPGNNCGWVFLDTSRNGTRRWCSMAGCGNRTKARRHRHKSRSNARRPKI
jgi:predicted RNA-binding Zn ribbon-like protein